MSTALATFKRDNGVATHRKTGAGHRYAWMAFFATVTMKDGTRRAFTELAHEYSMADLMRRNKVADAYTEEEACQFLAERNSIPWPADEPKRSLRAILQE
jgi:hypothetical protein